MMRYRAGRKTQAAGNLGAVQVGPSSAGSASTLFTNLTAWWALDEASGARADSHTNGLNLTDNNTVGSDTGVGGIGTAAKFIASNTEYLSRASETLLQPAGVFAIAFWVYPTTSNAQAWVNKYGSAGNSEYVFQWFGTGSLLSLYVSADGTNVAQATRADINALDQWWFVAGWYDGVNINLQINDGTVGTGALAGVYAGTAPFRIGYRSDDILEMDGRVAKVGYWKGYVPTAAQLTWLYNSGAGRSYSELASAPS